VEELILVAIFEGDSSLGIVRLFYETLEQAVAALPGFAAARPSADQATFERDLEAGLELLPDGQERTDVAGQLLDA
jgi:hypothetical protein